MIDVSAVCTFGGLFLIVAAYVVSIAPNWQTFRKVGNYVLWIGIALVLIGYFNLRHNA